MHKNALSLLAKLTAKQGLVLSDASKVRLLSLNNFIHNTLEIFRRYISEAKTGLGQFIPYYFDQKSDSKQQGSHALSTHLHTWSKYTDDSLEAKLLLLLVRQDENKQQVRQFLKIRKEITKVNNEASLLDQINLTHQQTIAIIHRVYNESKKKLISRKLNHYYISLNCRFTNDAKLQANVFAQFLLTYGGETKLAQEQPKPLSQEFSSIIDKNNGMVSSKRISKDSSKVQFINTNDSKLIIESRISQQNHQKTRKSLNNVSKENIQQTLNKDIMHRLFEREALQPHQDWENISETFSRREETENSKSSCSSAIAEKYSQDWTRMIQMNQNFKNKMLKPQGKLSSKRLQPNFSFDNST